MLHKAKMAKILRRTPTSAKATTGRHHKISTGVVHNVPPDLKKALISTPAALTAWEDITPLARNEWICWVTLVKKDETRKEHIKRTVSELKEGMRRPCCWLGCIHRTDKSVSPSVQAMLDRRSKKLKSSG